MSSPDLDASLEERLGGRWAISWQAFVFGAPLSIAVLALGAANGADIPAWLFVGVIATAVGALWVYVMHRTVFRDRAHQHLSMAWIVTLNVVSTALYVLTACILGSLLDLLGPDAIIVQFLPLTLVVISWGVLFTLTLDSRWRYRVQREELIQKTVQQQLASAQELEVLRDVRKSVLADVGQQVRSANQRLIDRIDQLVQAGEADAGVLARELRESAEASIRPLSHQLEERSREAHRTPGLLSGLGNIVRFQPFRPLAVSIVYAVLTTPRSIVENGPMIGLSVLAVTVAFIFAIMTGFNSAMRRWPQHRSAIFIIGLVAVQVPTVVLSSLRMELTGEVISIGDLIISMVIGTFIVLATSSFGAWDRSRREMITDFRREVDEETIATLVRSQALAEATMDAAIVLHGSVQTQLHACAFTLEEATRRGDLVEVNRALVHARALLEQPNLAPRAATATSIQDALEERIAQWRGLLAVTVSVNEQAEALSGVMAGYVADVVEEAIANAVHHGAATEVLVSVSCDSDELTVQVRDNGTGPSNGAPGLGSRLFSSYGSRWSLQALTLGAVLTVVIPSSVAGPGALLKR